MDLRMNRVIFGVILSFCVYGLPQTCVAANEYLSFGQSPSGDAFATVHGELRYCDVNGGFVGNPIVNIAPGGFEIASTIRWGECYPLPPPYPPPVPYELIQGLGTLPDGRYTVTWTYATVPPVVVLVTVHGVLWIEDGEVAIFHGSFE